MGEAINDGYGLGVMQRVPCAANGLATIILDEIQQRPSEEDAILIAIAKCVPHAVSVEGSQKVAPAGVLDCSTVMAMDVAGRVLLLETMGARCTVDAWSQRHFKNRSCQQPDGLESPRNAVLANLAMLIWDKRLIVSGRLGFDLASLGIGFSSVLAIDLATDQVVPAFLQDVVKLGGVAKDVEDFILRKPALPLTITVACSLFTGTNVELRYTQLPQRDVLRDAYLIVAIWRLLGVKILERRRPDRTQLALLNAVYVGPGQALEQVLDARPAEQAEQRIPLAQTTLRGEACDFRPVSTLGAFTSCLRYATHFTTTATDLNPATPCQVEVYAADLEDYTAASEAYRLRAEGPMEMMQVEFQPPHENLQRLGNTWCGLEAR